MSTGTALAVLLGLFCLQVQGAPTVIPEAGATQEPLRVVTLPPEKSARDHIYYFPALLQLALSKTEATDGPFEIHRYPRVLTGARFISKLKKNEDLDVIWSMTNADLERDLLRIPVSLLRGLNSYRVFLIRDEDRDRFATVRNLDDLKQFHAGMVVHWPDTAILKNNGLPVTTSVHYELLFSMLEGQRIDYFPRGLYEVWQEQSMHADKGIVVEPSLMLHYDGPIYFFVNRGNPALAERIERGLRIAMEDGSFDELFFSVPGFARGYKEISDSARRVFELPANGIKADAKRAPEAHRVPP